MYKPSYLKVTVVAITIAATAGLAGAITHSVASAAPLPQVADQSQSAAKANAANQAYQTLLSTTENPANPDSYFNCLLAAYDANMAMVDAYPNNSVSNQAKAVLVDLRPKLLKATFHYNKSGQKSACDRFATAYVDATIHPGMTGHVMTKDSEMYPTIVYMAAYAAFNRQDWARSNVYLKEYIATGHPKMRRVAYQIMTQNAQKLKDYQLSIDMAKEGMELFPGEPSFATYGVSACINGKLMGDLPLFLNKALAAKPDDPALLMIKGQLAEDAGRFEEALSVFNHLDRIKPNHLDINKHLAICNYNIGVGHYNESVSNPDEKVASRAKRQSVSYFNDAVKRLEMLSASEPGNVRWLTTLGICYGCLEDNSRFDQVNTRLQAVGHDPIGQLSIPPMMAYNADGSANIAAETTGHATAAQVAAGTEGVPSFQGYAGDYVTRKLKEWSQKGKYESNAEYQQRVTQGSMQAKYNELSLEAEQAYLRQYGSACLANMQIKPYDADNEVFLIGTGFGDIVVRVPRRNNEAELFETNWKRVNMRKPRFIIRNDQPALASVVFETPAGKKYEFNADDALTYTNTVVKIDYEKMLGNVTRNDVAVHNGGNTPAGPNIRTKTLTLQSDVDIDIPECRRQNSNTIAVIIANENYRKVSPVESALHDGETMAVYCEKVLGVPKNQILTYNDASLGDIHSAMTSLANIVNVMNGKANVIVYYAGHGMPDEATKNAYLLPVDGDGMIPATCYSLQEFYKKLGNMNAANVYVFMDACFSGAQRGEGMLMSARGVKLKPKEAAPLGNMFVLSAASGDETAMPYAEKNHGLFTYFLLKKLQDSKGNCSLQELNEYVTDQVRRQAVLVNKKPQTPTMTVSGQLTDRLGQTRLNR